MTDSLFLAEDIRFCYSLNEAALMGASIHIRAGACLAMVGANGAGKSTLLMALAGLIKATIGRAYIDDCQVMIRTSKDLKKHIKTALLMQDPDHQIIAPSLMQDVMLGPLAEGKSPEAAQHEATSILKSLGLDGLEWRAPHTLSLGQKKKAALAALLVSEPTLLLLDEPTAGLDGKGTRELLNLLQNCLHLQNAAVIATHDLSFIKAWADEVLVLDKGKTVEQLRLKDFLHSRRLLEICGFETEYEEDCTWKPPLTSPFPSP